MAKYILTLLFFVFTFFINTNSVCAYPSINSSNNFVISQKTNNEELFLNSKENNYAYILDESSHNYLKKQRYFSSNVPYCPNNLNSNLLFCNYKYKKYLSYSFTRRTFCVLLKNEIYTRAP